MIINKFQMGENWVLIYSSTYSHEIEIFKAVLKDNNIDSVIINKQDSSYLFGNFELYVKNNDVLPAKNIILNDKL